MTEALFKLNAWLSPAYPVGAYTYSHGLEWAVAEGHVTDTDTARHWIADCLSHGAGRSDAILLAHAWRASSEGDETVLTNLADLALALAPSAERRMEAEAQGAAFGAVTEAAWGGARPLPYPVAVGHAAASHGAPLDQAVLLYLQAFAANLISAAVRLVPLGQTDGQRVLAALTPLCLSLADETVEAPLDQIGGGAFMADIASMRHETQDVRIFRS